MAEPLEDPAKKAVVPKRPPVDTTVIDRAIEETLLKLTPKERDIVERARAQFREPALLKTARGKASPDMSLLEAVRTYLGNVKVDREGRVVGVPPVRLNLKGNVIPSPQLRQKGRKDPTDVDVKTAASYLQRVLGIPVVDESMGATQELLNLLGKHGNKPFGQVAREASLGQLGTASGITEAITEPPRPVITEPQFKKDREGAVSTVTRDMYYHRHKKNTDLKFGTEYTPRMWASDFIRNMDEIGYRSFEERFPLPGAEDERAGYVKRRGAGPGARSADLTRRRRDWEKRRLEHVLAERDKAFFYLRDKGKVPREVLMLESELLPGEERRPEPKDAGDVISQTLAAGEELAAKGEGLDLPEFGITETFPHRAARDILGQSVKLPLDERDLPTKQHPTLGSLMFLREEVDPAIEKAGAEISLQELLSWGRESGAIKQALEEAERINKQRMREHSVSPDMVLGEPPEEVKWVDLLRDMYRKRPAEKEEGGFTEEEQLRREQVRYEKPGALDRSDAQKRLDELYGTGFEIAKPSTTIAEDIVAGLLTAATIPARVAAAAAGATVGVAEALGAISGSLAGGRDVTEVRVLNPASDADRRQIAIFFGKYPNMTDEQKRTVGKAMVEGGELMTDLARDEVDRMKSMLSKDDLDRLKANANEIVEGLEMLTELMVGKTGAAYLATGKTAEERVMNSLSEGGGFGKMLGAGATMQLYTLLVNPRKYYKANPIDAIFLAVPILKSLQLQGKLKAVLSKVSEKTRDAVGTLLRVGDDLITKLDKKTVGSYLGLGVSPLKAAQWTGRKAILLLDKLGEVAKGGKARVDAFFRDPAAAREVAAAVLLTDIIDGAPANIRKIREIEEGLTQKLNTDGPGVAADWLEQKLSDGFGEGWRDVFPGIENKIALLKRAEDAPMDARGMGRFEETVGEAAKGADELLTKTVEDVAAGPLGDSITLTSRIFEDPDQVAFYGTDGPRSRSKHPRYQATSFLLNPEAQPKFLIADPVRTADTLQEMQGSGKVSYAEGGQLTGAEPTARLQETGFYDDRVTPTKDIRDAGGGEAFLKEAHEKVSQGLQNPAIDQRIRELRTNYVNVMDPDVLREYGFKNTREMLRSIGVGGDELKRLLKDTEVNQKLNPYHEGAGIHLRKDLLQKKTPLVEKVDVGMVRVEETLKSLKLAIKGAEKQLGPAIVRHIDPPTRSAKGTLGERRTDLLDYLRRLEAAEDGVLAKTKAGRLKPSVLENIRAARQSIQQALDDAYRNPAILMDDILDNMASGGTTAKWFGPESRTLLNKRKEMQARSKGGADKALTDELARLDDKLADSLTKDALGKEKAVGTAMQLVFATLENRKSKEVRMARSKAIEEATSARLVEDVAQDIIAGKRVSDERMPAALSEDPQRLIDRLDKGGELDKGGDLYNELYAKKDPGVSDFAFERQVKNLQQRLNRYVRADSGGKIPLDYLGLKEGQAKRTYVPKSLIKQVRWEVSANKAYGSLASMAKAGWTAGNLGGHVTNFLTMFQTQLGRGRGVMTPLYLLEEAQDIFARKTPEQLGMVEYHTRPDGTRVGVVDQAAYGNYTRMVDALIDTNFVDRGTVLRELNLAEKSISNPLDKKKARSVLETMREKAGGLAGVYEKVVYGPLKKAYGGMDGIAKWEQGKHSFRYFDDAWKKLGEGETLTYRIAPEGGTVRVRKGPNKSIWVEKKGKFVEATDADLAKIQARAAAAEANSVLFDYNKIPNIVKLNKILGRYGISLPFFTYFWKALDMPGYKKGLGTAILSGVPFIETTDKALRASHRSRLLKNAAKINAVNMTVRDRLKEMPEELIKELAGFLPRQLRAAFLKDIGIPGMVGVKEGGYIAPLGPTMEVWGALGDAFRGKGASTNIRDVLAGRGVKGVELAWFSDEDKEGKRDLDLDLDGEAYRNKDGSLTDLGKKTKMTRASIIKELSKPNRTGVSLLKSIGLGGGIFKDLVAAMDPQFSGDPEETNKLLEVMRRTATSVLFGSTAEKAIDGAIAGLEADGADVPPWLKSRLSKKLKQFQVPTYEQLSERGVSVIGDTFRRITSLAFDIRDIRGDKKRYLKNVRRQLNGALLRGVNQELKKIATEPGSAREVREKSYGRRSEEMQKRLDTLLAHRDQMRKIVDRSISELDTIATQALLVAERARTGKKLGKPLFEMRRGKDGKVRKRYFRYDPQTAKKLYLDEFESTVEREPTSEDIDDPEILEQALGLMKPSLVEQVKRKGIEHRRRKGDLLQNIPLPQRKQ